MIASVSALGNLECLAEMRVKNACYQDLLVKYTLL